MHYIKSFEKYILFIFEKYVFVIIAKAVSMINNTKSKIESNKELHKLYIQCLKIQLINLKNYSEFKNKFFQKYEKIHYKDLDEIQTNLINESLLINKNSKRPISQTIYFLDKVIFMIETQNECEDLEIISSELFKEIENFKIPGL